MKLFNRQKRPKLALIIYGSNGITARIPPSDFMLPERVVLSLSEHYFNDPEPCHIHRAAVLSRAMMELSEQSGINKRREISALSAEQRSYFGEYGDVMAFEFVEE